MTALCIRVSQHSITATDAEESYSRPDSRSGLTKESYSRPDNCSGLTEESYSRLDSHFGLTEDRDRTPSNAGVRPFFIAGMPQGIFRLMENGSPRESRGRHGRLCPCHGPCNEFLPCGGKGDLKSSCFLLQIVSKLEILRGFQRKNPSGTMKVPSRGDNNAPLCGMGFSQVKQLPVEDVILTTFPQKWMKKRFYIVLFPQCLL